MICACGCAVERHNNVFDSTLGTHPHCGTFGACWKESRPEFIEAVLNELRNEGKK